MHKIVAFFIYLMYNIPVRKRKQTKEYPMTRKHFEMIANGRFKTNRFLEACGL
jgi:hypothetical protein